MAAAGHAGNGPGDRAEQGEADGDAIAMLERHHRAMEALFDDLETETDARRARAKLFELSELLVGHARIDERHFYPALRTAETEALVGEALRFHLEMKKVLLHLLDADVSDGDFPEKLEELAGMVDAHVRREEDELFPAARSLLDGGQLTSLAEEMAATLVEEEDSDPREGLRAELAAAGFGASG
jgi:hemerythrin superfamily protein